MHDAQGLVLFVDLSFAAFDRQLGSPLVVHRRFASAVMAASRPLAPWRPVHRDWPGFAWRPSWFAAADARFTPTQAADSNRSHELATVRLLDTTVSDFECKGSSAQLCRFILEFVFFNGGPPFPFCIGQWQRSRGPPAQLDGEPFEPLRSRGRGLAICFCRTWTRPWTRSTCGTCRCSQHGAHGAFFLL